MKKRKIGNDLVGELGLGCMGMSYAYGTPDEAESLKTLHRALELGVNHWDTADMYGPLANEELLAKALVGKRDQVFLATKYGNVYDRTMTSHQDQVAANAPWIVDGTPAYARKSLEGSLKRLGVDHVDLYYVHRIDNAIPIEETIGGMAEFVKEGKVRYIGISEAVESTIRKAHAAHPIAAVQNELSLWTRDFLASEVPACDELGIAFVAYSPLGRGFLTGSFQGLLAPAGTPKPIIDKLHAEIKRIAALPDIKERLITLGAEPSAMTPEQFGQWVKTEIPAMAKIVKDEKITVE
jgi:aryl-alcohol dehydrogenase-like predicted oxidoreductase